MSPHKFDEMNVKLENQSLVRSVKLACKPPRYNRIFRDMAVCLLSFDNQLKNCREALANGLFEKDDLSKYMVQLLHNTKADCKNLLESTDRDSMHEKEYITLWDALNYLAQYSDDEDLASALLNPKTVSSLDLAEHVAPADITLKRVFEDEAKNMLKDKTKKMRENISKALKETMSKEFRKGKDASLPAIKKIHVPDLTLDDLRAKFAHPTHESMKPENNTDLLPVDPADVMPKKSLLSTQKNKPILLDHKKNKLIKQPTTALRNINNIGRMELIANNKSLLKKENMVSNGSNVNVDFNAKSDSGFDFNLSRDALFSTDHVDFTPLTKQKIVKGILLTAQDLHLKPLALYVGGSQLYRTNDKNLPLHLYLFVRESSSSILFGEKPMHRRYVITSVTGQKAIITVMDLRMLYQQLANANPIFLGLFLEEPIWKAGELDKKEYDFFAYLNAPATQDLLRNQNPIKFLKNIERYCASVQDELKAHNRNSLVHFEMAHLFYYVYWKSILNYQQIDNISKLKNQWLKAQNKYDVFLDDNMSFDDCLQSIKTLKATIKKELSTIDSNKLNEAFKTSEYKAKLQRKFQKFLYELATPNF
ncbi:hypothetical protein AAA435_12700 [Lactobacillus crispatus]|uniref:hypothetical protein n=1 Tax=Lactobacillus crispatus TaxID=47770 RepID=UPI0030FB7E8B